MPSGRNRETPGLLTFLISFPLVPSSSSSSVPVPQQRCKKKSHSRAKESTLFCGLASDADYSQTSEAGQRGFTWLTCASPGYSEHTETQSRSFTWLTLAAPRSSYLLSAHMVFFSQARRRLLRKHMESRTRDSSRHVQVNHLESALVTGRNVSSHFRERARESRRTSDLWSRPDA